MSVTFNQSFFQKKREERDYRFYLFSFRDRPTPGGLEGDSGLGRFGAASAAASTARSFASVATVHTDVAHVRCACDECERGRERVEEERGGV